MDSNIASGQAVCASQPLQKEWDKQELVPSNAIYV